MEPNAEIAFNYALLVIVARKVATLAQTNAEAAADYFDMHAQQLTDVEREIFSRAVVDQAIRIQSAA